MVVVVVVVVVVLGASSCCTVQIQPQGLARLILLRNADTPNTRGGALGSCEGGALPAIMPIAGPRETHDYRDYNLWVPGSTDSTPHPPKKVPKNKTHMAASFRVWGFLVLPGLSLFTRAQSTVPLFSTDCSDPASTTSPVTDLKPPIWTQHKAEIKIKITPIKHEISSSML